MNGYLLSRGLLVESDFMSLSPWLKINDLMLCDMATGAKHSLRPAGLRLTQKLVLGCKFKDWINEARQMQVDDQEIEQLVESLHYIGGLQIRRSVKGRLFWIKCAIALMRIGMLPRSRAMTSTLTMQNVCLQVVMAMKWLFVSTPVMLFLLYGIGYQATTVVGLAGYALGCLWMSTVLHEISHWLLIGTRRSQAVFIRRGLRLGILHPRLSDNREIASAITGPAVGAAASIITGFLVNIFYQSPEVWFVAISCAIFHVISWLPAYSDGAVINKILRKTI